MSLAPGVWLGPYEVLAFLGAGGMGEVYRARDARLGRDVALKVLAPQSAGESERLQRFEREARAASSLNHPNIVVVYDVGMAPSADREKPLHYIAMELVEGQSLESLLAAGALSVRRVLDLAAPLGDGLACAHESGIVHRDLKPSNIVVTPGGHPKILDFGLAKLGPTTLEEGGPRAETATAPGSVLGTVGYMSPEQAIGKAATAASDLFSFGCILYQMLTGRRAFAGGSEPETLAAIIREDPAPIEQIRPQVPAPLRWIVERCLAKLPGDRYASTRDLARDLQTLREHASDPGLAPVHGLAEGPRRASWHRVAAGAALGVLVSTAAWYLAGLRSKVEAEFVPLTFRRGVVGQALFAPSGNTILYTASWEGQAAQTYQTLPDAAGFDRSLDAQEQLPLSYSQDGSQVLVLQGSFRPSFSARGTLAWWPALGGKARPVIENVGWADWAERGHFFAIARDSGGERVLEIRDAAGGLQRTLFRTSGAITYVRLARDERKVAFVHSPSLNYSSGEVWIVGSDGSDPRAITPRFEELFGLDWNRRTGELWFTGTAASSWGSTLWSVGLSGAPRPLHTLPGRQILTSVAPSGDRCLLNDVANSSILVVRRKGQPLGDLTWFGWSVVTDLSPDGSHVLFFDAGATAKTKGTWMRPIAGGDAVRLTDGVLSRFSPDGRWIVTPTSPPQGPPQLALVPVGPGEPRQLTSSTATHEFPTFAGPSTLLFVRSERGPKEVWRMETDGSGARSLGAPDCDYPAASEREFVCVGDSGRAVFVFPMEKGPGRKLFALASPGQFRYVRWNRSGDRIYAVTDSRRFITVDAATGVLLAEETLPLSGAGLYDSLIGGAFDADASVQTYSVALRRSKLFLVTGLR
jgi:hypothetical protein